MPSANKLDYILDRVKAALATEATFTVLSTYDKTRTPNDTRILVYPFIAQVTQTPTFENSRAQEGVALLTVWCDVPVKAEGATPTGKTFDAYASVISKAEKALKNIDPSQETHTDSTSTWISGVNVIGIGGHVADGSQKTTADFNVQITYGFLV